MNFTSGIFSSKTLVYIITKHLANYLQVALYYTFDYICTHHELF